MASPREYLNEALDLIQATDWERFGTDGDLVIVAALQWLETVAL